MAAKDPGKTMADGSKRLLDELNEWLEAQGIAERVTFSKPLKPAEVEKAQKKLGVALPPSYVAFVTAYGTFHISGAITGRGEGNDTVLFSPADACRQTLEFRRRLPEEDQEEGAKIAEDGVMFCADPIDEDFHVFVISSADKKGEMRTRWYDYQDPACSEGWFEGDGTFASTVESIVENVRKNAGEG